MNIFASDPSPTRSALVLDDIRVRSQLKETAQLMSTALRLHGVDDRRLNAATHGRAGVTLWTARSRDNFMWLFEHGAALHAAYIRAFKNLHSSYSIIRIASEYADCIPEGGLTPFSNTTNYTHLPVHEAYKAALLFKWKTDRRRPHWTARPYPDFYLERTKP